MTMPICLSGVMDRKGGALSIMVMPALVP